MKVRIDGENDIIDTLIKNKDEIANCYTDLDLQNKKIIDLEIENNELRDQLNNIKNDKKEIAKLKKNTSRLVRLKIFGIQFLSGRNFLRGKYSSRTCFTNLFITI